MGWNLSRRRSVVQGVAFPGGTALNARTALALSSAAVAFVCRAGRHVGVVRERRIVAQIRAIIVLFARRRLVVAQRPVRSELSLDGLSAVVHVVVLDRKMACDAPNAGVCPSCVGVAWAALAGVVGTAPNDPSLSNGSYLHVIGDWRALVPSRGA